MTLPMAALPDPAASRAVLIGVTTYEHESMDPLPAVANNVATLSSLFTDPDVWGLAREHCVTLLNPHSAGEVLDAVNRAAREAREALVVYYAGHGLLDDRSELYLAMSDTDKSRIFRGVRYDDVRREVVGTALKCHSKVVILDCCFSGRALLGGMSGQSEVANHASIDGTYLMTASAETRMAMAPIGEEYTAFTGALVENLAEGVADGPDLLDLETLFFHVRARMLERNFPVPQQRTRNDGRAIAIARNRRRPATSARRRTISRSLPVMPEGYENVYRPRAIVTACEAMLPNERDLLLKAAGARLHDQSVAALCEVLDSTQCAAVIGGAAMRPPADVLAIVSALRETDQPQTATQLLLSVSARSPEESAAVAYALFATKATDDLDAFLDATLAHADGRQAITNLVNELWLAGLRDDVDALLRRAVPTLIPADVLALADDLRGAGREQVAYGLYVAAADEVARQPAERIAHLVAEMSEPDPAGSALVAKTAIATRVDAASVLALSNAFRATDQADHLAATLGHAAARLALDDVITVVDALLDTGEKDAALRLCTAALQEHPGAGGQLIAAMRDGGRPIDARRMLITAAARMPVAEIPTMLVGLDRADDTDRALSTIAERPVDEMLAIIDGLRQAGRDDVGDRLVAIISGEIGRASRLIQSILHSDDPGHSHAKIGYLLAQIGPVDAAATMPGLPEDCRPVVVLLSVQLGSPFLMRFIDALGVELTTVLHQVPAEWMHVLLPALRRADLGSYADNLAADHRDLPPKALAGMIQGLARAGDRIDVERLLDWPAIRQRPVMYQKDLIDQLVKHGLPDTAREVARNLELQAGTRHANLIALLRRDGLSEYAEILAASASAPSDAPARSRWPFRS